MLWQFLKLKEANHYFESGQSNSLISSFASELVHSYISSEVSKESVSLGRRSKLTNSFVISFHNHMVNDRSPTVKTLYFGQNKKPYSGFPHNSLVGMPGLEPGTNCV